MKKQSFEKAVKKAHRTKQAADFEEAFIQCLDNKSRAALESVYELADVVLYATEGYPYKREVKEIAVTIMFCWGEEGLSFILEKALIGDFGQVAMASSIQRALVYAASASIEMMAGEYSKVFPKLHQKIDYEQFKSQSFLVTANRILTEYVLNVQPEISIPYLLAADLALYSMYAYPAYKEVTAGGNALNPLNTLFSAIQTRWFRFNDKNLKSLASFLSNSKTEEEIHQYLVNNPQILEPFYAKIWSKVKLGEKLIADFLIKQMDGNYIVVEIEKPSDVIISKSGNLSAKTTHAIRQALEYRDWLASNQLYAQQNFDGLWRPSALVIIGKESDLSENQLARLKQENESRQGILRIVGFDWLYNRADTIRANIIRHNFDRLAPIQPSI